MSDTNSPASPDRNTPTINGIETAIAHIKANPDSYTNAESASIKRIVGAGFLLGLYERQGAQGIVEFITRVDKGEPFTQTDLAIFNETKPFIRDLDYSRVKPIYLTGTVQETPLREWDGLMSRRAALGKALGAGVGAGVGSGVGMSIGVGAVTGIAAANQGKEGTPDSWQDDFYQWLNDSREKAPAWFKGAVTGLPIGVTVGGVRFVVELISQHIALNKEYDKALLDRDVTLLTDVVGTALLNKHDLALEQARGTSR